MRRSLRLSLLLPLLFVLLLPQGCAKKAPPLVLVSGRVTLDDHPVAHALVRFQPAEREIDGRPAPESYGETDEDGNYNLRAVLEKGDAEGAVVGEHYVQISVFDRETGQEKMPAKYSTNSTLTFPVPAGGTKEANFKLSRK